MPELLFSVIMKRIGSLFPQRWISLGIENMQKSGTITAALPQMAMVLGLSAVLFAAAVMWERPVLILDKPTSGLDGRHMREMSKLLRGIADSGACVLVITHDTELINNCADTVS